MNPMVRPTPPPIRAPILNENSRLALASASDVVYRVLTSLKHIKYQNQVVTMIKF